MIKELNIKPYDKSLEDVSKFLDDLDFRKVKNQHLLEKILKKVKQATHLNLITIHINQDHITTLM